MRGGMLYEQSDTCHKVDRISLVLRSTFRNVDTDWASALQGLAVHTVKETAIGVAAMLKRLSQTSYPANLNRFEAYVLRELRCND